MDNAITEHVYALMDFMDLNANINYAFKKKITM